MRIEGGSPRVSKGAQSASSLTIGFLHYTPKSF